MVRLVRASLFFSAESGVLIVTLSSDSNIGVGTLWPRLAVLTFVVRDTRTSEVSRTLLFTLVGLICTLLFNFFFTNFYLFLLSTDNPHSKLVYDLFSNGKHFVLFSYFFNPHTAEYTDRLNYCLCFTRVSITYLLFITFSERSKH